MHDAMASSSLEYERITFVLRPRRGPRRVILDAVSGRAAAAQTTALMGPSGSGKTTLIHALAGTLRSRVPAELSGAVRVDGEPAGARRRCAVVGQEDALFPLFTVRETLTLCAALTRRGEDPDRVAEATLRRLGLAKVAETRVGDPSEPLLRGVSGGERRRLSIGCELIASRGGVVLLDEPTSSLDAYQALSVARSLSGLARESRVAVLLSVHQPRAEICLLLDELQLLSRGRVVRWLAHRTLVGFSRQTVVVVAVTSTHLLPALILVAMRSDERDGGGGLGAVRRNVDKLGTFSYMGMLLTYFGLMQVALFFAKEKPVVRSELGRYDLGAFGTRDVGRFCAELAVVVSLNWAVGAVGFVFACSDIHEADMRQITLQFATFFTLVSGVYCCLTSMPAWTRELAALSPTKWAIEALVTLEFPRPDQRYVLDTAGYERLPAARAVGILLLMAAAGQALALRVLAANVQSRVPLRPAPARRGGDRGDEANDLEAPLLGRAPPSPGGGAVSRYRGGATVAFEGLTLSIAAAGGRRRVVDRATATVPRGALVALMGPSGSGKSSLLNALASCVPAGPDARLSGAVSVDGARVDTRAARAAFAALRAYVRQDCFLFPYLTVRETLHLSASLALRAPAGLVVRATRSEFRDPRFFFVDVTFTLVAAGYACMVWSAMERDQRGLRNVTGLLYFCLATQTAKACSIGCQVATATEALVEQERGMYATAALAATRLLVGNAKVCIQPTLLLVVAYVGTGAGRDPAAFGRILAFYLGAVSACYAFGLATLCIPGVENQARDFWTNQSLFFCILPAGYFINIHTIPRSMKWLALVSPQRWALNGMLTVQLTGVEFSCDRPVLAGACCPTGDLYLDFLDYAGYGERRCAAYLAAVLAVMTTLSYLGLRRAPEYADLKATAVHDDGETAAEPPAPDPRDSSERR
ncbi:ATPase [Aureococcus anophagefferens]|nr:ATPase [Aureococcus anophagefferens]